MACRLCLHVFENDSEYMEMTQYQGEEFLVNFLFEVLDMEISIDPLICKNCKTFTEKIHRFLEDCLIAQNKLYEYIRQSGLSKLSNEDLVRIAKEHKLTSNKNTEVVDISAPKMIEEEPPPDLPQLETNLEQDPNTQSTEVNQIVENPAVSENVDGTRVDDPDLNQHVITEDTSNIEESSETGLSKDSDNSEDMSIYEVNNGEDTSETGLSKESDNSEEILSYDQLNSNILYYSPGESDSEYCKINSELLNMDFDYGESEMLLEISDYDQSVPKIHTFNQNDSEILTFNPSSETVFTSSDYSKADPKIFECSQTELEVLNLRQTSEEILQNSPVQDEVLEYSQVGTDIIGYDQIASDILECPPGMEILANDRGIEETPGDSLDNPGLPEKDIVDRTDFEEAEDETEEEVEGGDSEPQEGDDMKHTSVQESLGKEDNGGFMCDQCGIPFRTKRGVASHIIQKHIRGDLVECTMCNYKTTHKTYLQKHMKVHSREGKMKTHKCPHCDYQSPRKYTVHVHMKFVHAKKSELEVFSCTQCDYQTVRKSNLTSHMKYKHSQAGELETLHCPLCEYETVRKKYLQNHMKYKHNENGKVKLHFCTMCEFKTYKEDSMQLHFLSQHPDGKNVQWQKCPMCSYQTVRKGSMRLHLKTSHKKETDVEGELFSCPDCPFQSFRRDTLRKHMKYIHFEDGTLQVFKCKLCSYQTVRKNDYERHVKFKHKNEGL